MVNTKRGRFTFGRSLGVFLLSVPLGTNAVEISNGVPDGTLGSYRVDVESGGDSRVAVVTAARFASKDIVTTNVVRNYYAFVDPGIDGLGDRLSSKLGSAPVPDPINPNIVTSSGAFSGANGNNISWTAESSIAPGAQVLTNTYRFTAETGVLGPLRVLQYLDKNTLSTLNDVFSHTGSAVGGDLELFTFDNTEVFGLSHSGTLLPGTELQNASFAGWAADRFDNIITSIFTAGQLVSPAGIIANLPSFQHPQLGPVFGPEDIVSVLAWDVDPNATSARITTFLREIPISVEARPSGSLSLSKQARCGRTKCSVRVTCIIANAPGASCTNEVRLMVAKKALRTPDGAIVKAPQLLFARGRANVRPGQNRIVQLRLTKPARDFVGSTTKKKINGTLEIESIDGVALNAFRASIRIIK